MDAVVANDLKRPSSCITRYTPSKGSVYGHFSAPTSDISKFSRHIPLITRFGTKLIDIMYEADNQKYESPSINSLSATLQAFDIIKSHQLWVNSYTPIKEGGVALDMYYNKTYIHIQFDNENDAALYIEIPEQNPQGWDLSYPEALAKLKELLA